METDETLRVALRAIVSIITFGIVGAFFWYLKKHRATAGVKRPRKVRSFLTNQPPERILEILRRESGRFGYQIEETVPSDADLLLSEPQSTWSFGFYYPIYLKPVEKYQTQVEIGIESKVFQYGPVVKKHHRACLEKIKAALGRPPENV